MEQPFDYSIVPFGFGLCAIQDCPLASTCLRHTAFRYAPAKEIFVLTINPAYLKAMKGKCNKFLSNEKTHYAKGFMCIINTLTVQASNTFRNRMIHYFGRKNYYAKRKGEMLISPAEQERIKATANELGVILNNYFDSYIDEYNWG